MPVVAIGEGAGLMPRIDGDNTAVAQRNAVGVVGQVALDLRRSAKGTFGIKDESACCRARRTSEYGWQVS